MTYRPLITLYLRIISVRCVPLNLRSKTRRWSILLLLLTWIFSFQSIEMVNFELPFTTSETISSSILQTFCSWVATSHLRPPMTFHCTTHLIHQGLLLLWMFYSEGNATSNKLLRQEYVKERMKLSLKKLYVRSGILSNHMSFPFPDCYATFLRLTYTMTPFIDKILNPFVTMFLIWILLPNLTFYPLVRSFDRTFATGAVFQQKTLTPTDAWSCPVWIYICATWWD